MEKQFERVQSLIGDNFKKLETSHVAVFGIGGVGCYIIEALVRSGIGEISIIDNDTVSASNLNRQIIATQSTIGKNKTDVMKDRISEINPNCIVHTYTMFFDDNTEDQIPFNTFDYVADAIDSVKSKLRLIEICTLENIPIISSMGTGNKLDPTKLTITDISKTNTCPLARTIRRELGKIGIKKLKVVYSTEQPSKSNITDNKKIVPSSMICVPATAGLIMASHIIQEITK